MTSYIASLEAAKPYLNHADHFDEKMVEGDVTLREFLSGFLSYYPSWIHTLYRIRAGFVRLLGMKQEGMPGGSRLRPEDISFQAGQMETFFKIREGSEHSYWIASAQDKHLTADLIVVAESAQRVTQSLLCGDGGALPPLDGTAVFQRHPTVSSHRRQCHV